MQRFVRLCGPQIEAFEQPLELLHRQHAGGLADLGRRPGEALGFEPFVTPSGMQTFPPLRRALSA